MRKAGKDSPFKFASQHKLVSKQDFQFVFAKAQKIERHYFLILYRPNSRTHPRLGMVMPKSRVKKAVARNQLRRIIRESFRLRKKSLKELDIIVMIRSKCTPFCLPVDKKRMRDDIDNLWLMLKKGDENAAATHSDH